MADKLRELPPLYKNARSSIKIATDFDKEFFEKEVVKKALTEAHDCNVQIRIISEGPIIEDYKGIAEIKTIPNLTQHVMIIDGTDVRLEKPHCGRSFGSDKSDVAFILKGFPDLAKKVETVFDKLWNSIQQS
jgi:hypothetical protein